MTPTQAMFNNMAREPVELENVSGTLYVFGSELATLRIFAKYNANGAHPNSKARVGHSVNLGKFYFALENVPARSTERSTEPGHLNLTLV